MSKVINRGIRHKRTEFIDPYNQINKEKIFADAWEEENIPKSWLNQGYGCLQNHFITRPNFHTMEATHKINLRERMIVATIIQWLGTNVGWCWLNETVEKCGYKIIKQP